MGVGQSQCSIMIKTYPEYKNMISKLESEIQSDLSLEEQVPGKSDVLRPEAEFTSHCSPVEMLFPSLFVRDLENGKN